MNSSEIIKKYPELFGKPPFDPKKSLICFGLEVTKYWLPTLDKGFEKISKIIKDEDISDFRIIQVKEKFGGLRIYTGGTTYSEKIEKIIDDLEIEVENICQKCGSNEGKLNGTVWLRIICEDCLNKED